MHANWQTRKCFNPRLRVTITTARQKQLSSNILHKSFILWRAQILKILEHRLSINMSYSWLLSDANMKQSLAITVQELLSVRSRQTNKTLMHNKWHVQQLDILSILRGSRGCGVINLSGEDNNMHKDSDNIYAMYYLLKIAIILYAIY